MPTGYTAELTEREVQFPDFAMKCARAFGALVMMREDPMDAPIPEFQPSEWNAQQLAQASAEFDHWATLSLEEREQMATAAIKNQIAQYQEHIKKENRENAAYDAMAAQVAKWNPPTPEHNRLKAFMLEQISISRNDPTYYRQMIETAKLLDLSAWIAYHEASLLRSIEYHRAEDIAERKRTSERNKWIKDLRESLKAWEREYKGK